MGARVNYTIIGLFVLICGSGLIYAIYWFSKDHESRPYNSYLVFMNESVAGLTEQAQVRFNGVNVGYVQSVQINHLNLQQVRLHLKIVEGTPITEDTYAMLMSRGITGLSYIGLSSDSPMGRPLKPSPGEPYPIIKSRPSFLVEIDRAISDVTRQIKLVAQSIQGVLDGENQENFRQILNNLEIFTGALSKRSVSVGRTLALTEQVMDDVSKGSERFPDVIKRMQSALQNIEQVSAQIDTSAKSFENTMEDSRTFVNQLSSEVLPGVAEVVDRLEETLTSISTLANQIEHNPTVLVRGKVITKKGPGE